MITFILCLISTTAICIFALIIGEFIAEKYPNTRFNNWWRRNIIYKEKN